MNKEIRKQLGEALKKLRRESGMSQVRLGNKLGKSQPHIAMMEQGTTGDLVGFNEALEVFGYTVKLSVVKK